MLDLAIWKDEMAEEDGKTATIAGTGQETGEETQGPMQMSCGWRLVAMATNHQWPPVSRDTMNRYNGWLHGHSPINKGLPSIKSCIDFFAVVIRVMIVILFNYRTVRQIDGTLLD